MTDNDKLCYSTHLSRAHLTHLDSDSHQTPWSLDFLTFFRWVSFVTHSSISDFWQLGLFVRGVIWFPMNVLVLLDSFCIGSFFWCQGKWFAIFDTIHSGTEATHCQNFQGKKGLQLMAATFIRSPTIYLEWLLVRCFCNAGENLDLYLNG